MDSSKKELIFFFFFNSGNDIDADVDQKSRQLLLFFENNMEIIFGRERTFLIEFFKIINIWNRLLF